MKTWKKSRTMLWGHIQNTLGMIVLMLGMFVPQHFPGFPAWAYGLALVVSGVITYWLRVLTNEGIGK